MTKFETRTELRPYQAPAVQKLLPSRIGALFMDMGTGKTRTTIEFASLRQNRCDRVVWFCPVSLKDTIAQEIRKHTNCVDIFVADHKTASRNLPKARWNIIGIESMSSSDRTVMAANALISPHTFVCVDESSYIKGHRALRTRRISALSAKAKYRLILTGTPISQGIQDLYGQLNFLSPKILGYQSFYSFAANHLEYSDRYPGLIVRAHNTSWISAKMHPYVYQLSKDEAGIELPEKIYDSRYVSLTAEQERAYEQAKREMLMSEPEGLLDPYVIFQLFTALQQIVSGFWNRGRRTHELPQRRLETLEDVLLGLPENEKVVIWCKYWHSAVEIVKMLAKRYGQDAVSRYYGVINEKRRAAELERWRRESRFLVATQATGGHGLTLNETAYMIFYENSFRYADRLQAEERNRREGQARRTTYIDIITLSGIDERISDSLARKGDVVSDFRRQIEMCKGMTHKQLREHLRSIL